MQSCPDSASSSICSKGSAHRSVHPIIIIISNLITAMYNLHTSKIAYEIGIPAIFCYFFKCVCVCVCVCVCMCKCSSILIFAVGVFIMFLFLFCHYYVVVFILL